MIIDAKGFPIEKLVCPCGNKFLSLSDLYDITFYDNDDPDEKYWRERFITGHCWQCGKTSFFVEPD